jgi:hypothetical protein
MIAAAVCAYVRACEIRRSVAWQPETYKFFSHRLLGQHGGALNAALPDSIASGTGSGVAMAAAAGLADIGLGVDHLSGPRVGLCVTLQQLGGRSIVNL